MNQYEVMYILDAALEDQVRTDAIARFSALVAQNGGTVDRVDEWGKRRLAYTINYKTEGYYVLMYVTAPAELPRELERNLQIADSVLRYLVIRFEGPIPPKMERRTFAPAGHVTPVAAAPSAQAAPAQAPVEAATEAEAPQSAPEPSGEPVAEV